MGVLEVIRNMGLGEKVIDLIILGFGLFVLIKLILINKKMKEIKEESDSAYNTTSSKAIRNARGNLEKNTKEEFNRQAHEPIRKRFNAANIKYIKYVSLISVLPLMGLLGTVWGLMPGLMQVQNGDFDALYGSLSTALSSTLVGLVWAIILKIYAAARPDQVVNGIETDFDEIDRLYEMQ